MILLLEYFIKTVKNAVKRNLYNFLDRHICSKKFIDYIETNFKESFEKSIVGSTGNINLTDKEANNCKICSKPLIQPEDDQPLKIYACNHHFHEKCFSAIPPICPICNYPDKGNPIDNIVINKNIFQQFKTIKLVSKKQQGGSRRRKQISSTAHRTRKRKPKRSRPKTKTKIKPKKTTKRKTKRRKKNKKRNSRKFRRRLMHGGEPETIPPTVTTDPQPQPVTQSTAIPAQPVTQPTAIPAQQVLPPQPSSQPLPIAQPVVPVNQGKIIESYSPETQVMPYETNDKTIKDKNLQEMLLASLIDPKTTPDPYNDVKNMSSGFLNMTQNTIQQLFDEKEEIMQQILLDALKTFLVVHMEFVMTDQLDLLFSNKIVETKLRERFFANTTTNIYNTYNEDTVKLDIKKAPKEKDEETKSKGFFSGLFGR